MKTYHKIQTIFKRDPGNNNKTLLEGDFSLPEFELLQNIKWIGTEKVNGTNIRVTFENGKLREIKGKTDKAEIPKPLMDGLSKMFPTDVWMHHVEPISKLWVPSVASVCLYGEGYGLKINGGGKYTKEHSFVLFDIKVDDLWLPRESVVDISNQLNIEVVPIVFEGKLREAVYQTKVGFKSRWGDFEAEGLVLRPEIELCDRRGERIITKIKCKDFMEVNKCYF